MATFRNIWKNAFTLSKTLYAKYWYLYMIMGLSLIPSIRKIVHIVNTNVDPAHIAKVKEALQYSNIPTHKETLNHVTSFSQNLGFDIALIVGGLFIFSFCFYVAIAIIRQSYTASKGKSDSIGDAFSFSLCHLFRTVMSFICFVLINAITFAVIFFGLQIIVGFLSGVVGISLPAHKSFLTIMSACSLLIASITVMYLILRLSMFFYAIIIDNKGIIDSLKYSSNLVSKNWWYTAVTTSLPALFLYFCVWSITMLLLLIPAVRETSFYWIIPVGIILGSFYSVYLISVRLELYKELSKRLNSRK